MSPPMSVMRVIIVLHPYTKFEVRIGFPILIFGHGVKRPGDLDL